jgi:hypothetical protein
MFAGLSVNGTASMSCSTKASRSAGCERLLIANPDKLGGLATRR